MALPLQSLKKTHALAGGLHVIVVICMALAMGVSLLV